MAEEVTVETLQAQLTAAQARLKEVNDEAKGHRLNAGEARKEADAFKKAAEDAAAAAEAKIAETDKAAAGRHEAALKKSIDADLKVAAKDAGAADVADVLALIPRDKLKVDDDGNVTNATELLAEMKTAKPYLFGAVKTGSTAKVPPTKDTDPVHATKMTEEEYRAARKKAISGR